MLKVVRTLMVVTLLSAPAGAVLLGGCEAPGVGDPCQPEQIPEGGFVRTEAYLETSSVQCRTRVCMVYKLPGFPTERDGTCSSATGCATLEETNERVYCTCRCDAPEGSTTSTCECPDGFSCQEVLELGGEGIRGSYCVKSGTIDPEDGA